MEQKARKNNEKKNKRVSSYWWVYDDTNNLYNTNSIILEVRLVKKDSKFNDLIQKAIEDETYIDSYYEWESYDKNYSFPVYRLHVGSQIFVWKIPMIKEKYDKEEMKLEEMMREYIIESIYLNGKYSDHEAIKTRMGAPRKKWSGRRFTLKAVSNEGNF